MACSQPAGYVTDSDDCDDNETLSNPDETEVCDGLDNNCDGTMDEDSAADAPTWYADTDSDGYGNLASSVLACTQPSGYVTDNTDCDDTQSSIYLGATEYCNGTDDNCDGSIDESTAEDAPTWYADSDEDGFGNVDSPAVACTQPTGYTADATDCNDSEPLSNPGQSEVCDSLDNNCDGVIDEDSAVDAATWYADTDGDSFGDPINTALSCLQPSGYVADSTDCDDTQSSIYLGATEYCNGADDNCDGSIDESTAVDASTWYADTDGDSFGDPTNAAQSCAQPSGYVADSTDCDDAEALANPAESEVCDTIDNNCNGVADEDEAVDALTWYADSDGDGQGNSAVFAVACDEPTGYVDNSTDCDDTQSSIYYGALEYCNGQDDNCDGAIDESSAVDAPAWYADGDADGFGSASTSVTQCSQSSGYLSDNSDCDDTNSAVNPAETEVCDTIDNDCDGVTDEDDAADASTWYADADADGYGDPASSTAACDEPSGYVADSTDCDDAEPLANPGETEVCDDFIDNDCDGTDNGCSLSGTISLSSADAKLIGEAASDWAGYSVSGAGDVDGDGLGDILVGARGNDAGGASDAGAAYLVLGPVSGTGSLSTASAKLTGETAYDNAGSSVASAGDANGDGLSDILVGARYNGTGSLLAGGSAVGAAYLVYGSVSGTMSLSSADAKLTGEAASDYAGSVSGAGDADGDGFSDILVGAYGEDAGGSSAGAAYLLYGGGM
ncbi:MAG: FG-GAP repeat protein [Deltaproteobacteria bacterium]|nr:FG-GAP repeat protein [Deltaproteobacteria bacterium]